MGIVNKEDVIGWEQTAGDRVVLCLKCAGENPGENYRPLTEYDFRADQIVSCDNIISNDVVCGRKIW